MMIAVIVVIVLLVGGGIFYAYHKSQQLENAKMMQAKIIKTQEDAAMKQKQQEAAMTAKTSLVMMAKDNTNGSFVTAANDMTLYTFDFDTANKSNCTGICATIWPAYLSTGTLPSSMPAHLGTFKRVDGSIQFTWDSKPLYYYSKDKKVGDTNGDGIGGVWHIAK